MSSNEQQQLRLLLAARASRKASKDGSLGIETQDERAREWADRQGRITTVHGTYEGIEIVDVAADYKRGTVAPWDRPKLRPWVTRPDMMQKIDGILAYRNDRLSRGEWDDEVRIRQWASQNHKVLVIVDGPQWPPRNEGDRWAWEANANQAHKEWEEIRERSMRAQHELRERGKLVGFHVWGYQPTGPKYDRTLAPTNEGRKYAEPIFQYIADGRSLSWVAAWLESEGVKSPRAGRSLWPTKTIAGIIRNPTYRGEREDGSYVLKVEPLVNAKLWKQANDRLDAGITGRRQPSNGETALLTGALFCPLCPQDGKYAPMYRHAAGGTSDRLYYRCNGHYPRWKGCGNSVPLEMTNTIAVAMLSSSKVPWPELQLVPGENHDVELAAIALALERLPKRKLSRTEEQAERERLWAEQDRLAALPNVPDEWKETDTTKTVGQHFTSLNHQGRRGMITEEVIFFAKAVRDRETRKITPGPFLTMISNPNSHRQLFKVPVEWINEE